MRAETLQLTTWHWQRQPVFGQVHGVQLHPDLTNSKNPKLTLLINMEIANWLTRARNGGSSPTHFGSHFPDEQQIIFLYHFDKAVETIRAALHVYKPSELCLSFNGGKDCTVLLHLLRFVLFTDAALYGDVGLSSCGVQVVHFQTSDNFAEVLAFQADTATKFGFTMRELPGLRSGLATLAAEGIRGVFMGTRSTDPDGIALSPFTPTSISWPPCMRICPVLTWSYANVWMFLRGANLPVCDLYQQGYTSVGAAHNSSPNPTLRRLGTDGTPSYLPAWELTDGTLERLGRYKPAAPASPAVPIAAPPDISLIQTRGMCEEDPGLASILGVTGALPLRPPVMQPSQKGGANAGLLSAVSSDICVRALVSLCPTQVHAVFDRATTARVQSDFDTTVLSVPRTHSPGPGNGPAAASPGAASVVFDAAGDSCEGYDDEDDEDDADLMCASLTAPEPF
jgi:FAD synthetase